MLNPTVRTIARNYTSNAADMSVRFLQVDAFSAAPFGGNPAAVVMMPAGASDDGLMQRIAAENNLAETAFVIPLSADASDAVGRGSRFGLRWFTPKCEVDLCGHATLATAAALALHASGSQRSRWLSALPDKT
jgi:PhzF family phenazine biosynthesis protein